MIKLQENDKQYLSGTLTNSTSVVLDGNDNDCYDNCQNNKQNDQKNAFLLASL